MKNTKKVISAISALSLTASAFAGLTITAHAELATTEQTVAPAEITYIASANPDTAVGENPEVVYANMSKIQGGAFIEQDTTNNPAQVALIKFDAKEYAGRIKSGKINLTAKCQTAGKNSNVQVASIGTDWTAADVTWNAMDSVKPVSYVGDLGFANDAGLTGSVDISDVARKDEDGMLAFGVYTATARQQALTDISLTLDVTDDPIEYVTVKVNKMNGDEILETVDVNGIMLGDSFTASGEAIAPVVKDGATYVLAADANLTLDPVEVETTKELKTVSKITGDAVKYIAEYNEDKTLKSVTADPISVTEDEELDVSAPEGAKAFIWSTEMEPIAVTKEVEVNGCASLNLPYEKSAGSMVLSENFNGMTDTWGFSTGTGVAANAGGYLDLCTLNGSEKTDTKTFDDAVKAVKYAQVKFDWKTTVDLANTGGGRISYFAVTDADNNAIFAIGGASSRSSNPFTKVAYGMNDTTTGFTKLGDASDNNFYTVDLTIDFVNKKLNGTIVNSAGANVATITDQAITADAIAGLKAINLGSSAPMAIDNFSIMALNMPTASFTVKNDKGEAVEGATVTVSTVTAKTDAEGKVVMSLPLGTYTAEISAPGHVPTTVDVTVGETGSETDVVLTYAGVTHAAKVVLSGGSEIIYKPATGSNSTEALTAVIYDNVDQIMADEAIVWSLPNNNDEALSVENGVLTVTSEMPLTDINGLDVVIRAASASDPTVYAEYTVHIRDVAQINSFTVTGPAVVKDGKTAEFGIADVKDQYGEPLTVDAAPVFSTDNEAVTFSGTTMTAETGTANTVDVTVKAAIGEVNATKTVTVYGYDYYEPGKGNATYGTPRMAAVNGVNTVVWPDSKKTTTITLPEPVKLDNGTAKMISFKNTWTNKTVGSQERSLTFKNSAGNKVLAIDFAGDTVVTDYTVVNKNYTGTKIGLLGNAGVETEAIFIIKTDAAGTTTADLMYNGESISVTLGENLTDIASYVMVSGDGAPGDRLLTLTDMRISNSDVKMVEVSGADKVARISGKTATSQFKASIFSQSEGESFVWSVAGAEGVTIDNNGVLSVAETVAPETVVTVSCTSDKDATKTDSVTVTIKDYAAVKSYEIEGPSALDAGSTGSYKVVNIVDEYDAVVDMPVSFTVKSGDNVAEITADGIITGKTADGEPMVGDVVLEVTIGNPDKATVAEKTVKFVKSMISGDVTADETKVDVTSINGYSTDLTYRVTVLKNDGTYTITDDVTAADGIVTINTAGASKYEVSPIFTKTNVGDARNGVEFAVTDGRYDVTVKKSTGQRGDIMANGYIIGQNVDQYGKYRAPKGSVYTANDVASTGGSLVISTGGAEKDGYMLDYITVKKAPTIVPRKQHVYVLGDSLVSAYYGDLDGETNSQTGWGQVLDNFIADDVNLTNLAESGNYAKGLYDSVFKTVMAMAQPGDVLVFECGYNDRNYPSELAEAARVELMKETMQKVYDESNAKGINLVFVTPNASTHGTAWKPSVQKAGDVVAKCTEMNANLIDLAGQSFKYISSCGATEDEAKTYTSANFMATGDNLHSSYLGAMMHAGIVAKGMTALGGDFAKAVNPDATVTINDANGTPITIPVAIPE